MKKELLFAIFAINSGCSNAPNNLLNATRTLMVERNELQFRNAALIFIESAKKNDVDKMISMTSSISINRIGLNSAKEVYRNRVIPDFYGATTILRDTGKIAYDEKHNSGFIFDGVTSKANKKIEFEIVVFGEGGKYVIGSIRRK